MKLKSKKLADVTLVPVETRSRTKIFLVESAGVRWGIVEKMAPTKGTTHPWKAFRGVGIGARYITAFYKAGGGLDAAVACVLERSL
jgi:hypothetical protein